jgi:thiol-disulfide isomerase/thioredoxin
VDPDHLRLDLSIAGSRAVAVHDAACPEIGPICTVRAEPPQRHHTTLLATDLRLIGEYGLARGLALQAAVPLRIIGTTTGYTDLSDRPIALDYPSIHHHDETLVGPGDAQLLLHGGRKVLGLSVGARAGVSIPLGVVHEDPYRLAAQGLSHEHIQLGTGTWDPVLSLDASGKIGSFTLAGFAALQAPLYQGPQGYRAGARSQGGLVLARPLDAVTVRLSAQLLHEQPERWQGRVPSDDGNQGRTDLYVAPGLTWNFAGEWMVSADVRVRAYSQVVNAQLDMPVVLELGIGRLFHLESDRSAAGGSARGPLVGESDRSAAGGSARGPLVGEQGFDEPPQSAAAAQGGDVLDLVQAGELAELAPAPGKWTVFDFWAPWCEACKVLDKRLRALAAQRPGLAVRRVNIVDFKSPIARRELPAVSQLPHLRLVRDGGAVVYEASGPEDELLAAVEARSR